mmetsp:Transcript_10377/g.26333  ORF Transcript_10377/g.26333 Transcript_10377/m.26333 type:complete len:394 (-) Transcript_10377:143-1324(-)
MQPKNKTTTPAMLHTHCEFVFHHWDVIYIFRDASFASGLRGCLCMESLARLRPLFEDPRGLSGALHLLRHGDSLGGRGGELGRGQGEAGVEAERVCDRSAAAAEDVPEHLRVDVGIAALEVAELARCDAEVAGGNRVLLHPARRHLHHVRRARRRQLVDAHRVHHKRLRVPQLRQRLRHQPLDFLRVHTNQRVRNLRRVEHGAQDVECGPDFERLPDGDDGLHGGVVARCEHEPDPRLREACLHLLRAEINDHAELLQDVRASAQAGHGPVAVLCDGEAAGRGEYARSRRNVDGARAVAARPHDVHGRVVDTHLGHLRLHGGGEPGHLVRRLPLRAEEDEEGRDARGVPFVDEGAQHVPRRRHAQVLTSAQRLQHLGHLRCHLRCRRCGWSRG